MVVNSKFRKKFEKLNKKILNIKDIDAGILGGIHEKYWIKCDNKDYLFKFNQNEKDLSDFGEVFTSYICYILGVKCVESIFAEDYFGDDANRKRGVLIESYRAKNIRESFSLSSLIEKYKRRNPSNYGYTVDEAIAIAKEFCYDNNIILDENLEQNLKEMALMDYLLIQGDRHAKNIEFLIEEKDGYKKLKLAPMFDNGFCLYLQNLTSKNKQILNKFLTKKIVNVDLTLNNPKPKFYIEKTENFFDEGECIVKDLTTELLQNKKLMNIFEKFCKLNMSDEIEFISSLGKKSIPNINKQLIQYGVTNRIKLLDLELLQQKNKIDNFEQV